MGRYSNQDSVTKLQAVLAGQGRDRPPARPTRSVRQKQVRLGAEDVDRLVERYGAGESVYALAEAFGLNRRTVSKHPGRREVATRYRILTDDQLSEAAMLYTQGWSLARLGERFAVSEGTMLNALKRTGVPTRPVGTNRWPPRSRGQAS